jgi:putative PIN family toxin of toxin-antitoxin system
VSQVNVGGKETSEAGGRIRAVLDTNVWVDIFLHDVILPPKQPYTAILDAFFDDKFEPVYCAETRDELEQVLKYAKSVGIKYNTSPALVDEFIQSMLQDQHAGVFVEITGEVFVCSDEDDDKFAEAAVVGHARYLVSNDPHLHEHAVKQYLAPHGIRVLWAPEFRKILDQIPAK